MFQHRGADGTMGSKCRREENLGSGLQGGHTCLGPAPEDYGDLPMSSPHVLYKLIPPLVGGGLVIESKEEIHEEVTS